MGEYFMWVNPAKKETLGNAPFNKYGFMINVASHANDRYTDAACTLINGRWKGDPVVYLGDYFSGQRYSGEPLHEHQQRIYGTFHGSPYEEAICTFQEIGGIFVDAKGLMYSDYLNHEGEDVSYEGPFTEEVRHWRYAVNVTRGEFVDRENTAVKCILECGASGYEIDRFDPIPHLYSPSSNDDEEMRGRWCFDEVYFTDDAPPATVRDASLELCKPFLHVPCVACDDATFARIVQSGDFVIELTRRGITTRPPDISLWGAVDILADLLGAENEVQYE